MDNNTQPEVWMRGPISGVPPLLQPVAHALLQAGEEIVRCMTGFDDRYLWKKPAGMASAGFHLQHITGVIDRLFTYAQSKPLSLEQLDYLQAEGKADHSITSQNLVTACQIQINAAVDQLRKTDETDLTSTRYLGRKRIPTTLMGLLFHAAEHTQRHVGQLLVTVRVVPRHVTEE